MKRISMLIVAFVLFAIPAWAIYQSSTFGNRSGVAAVGGSCSTLVDSQTDTDGEETTGFAADYTYYAGKVSLGGTRSVCKVGIIIRKVVGDSDPVYAFTVELRSNGGSAPGSVIGTSTTSMGAADLSASHTEEIFEFSSPLSLANGDYIVIKFTTIGDGGDYIEWAYDSGTFQDGQSSSDGSAWTDRNNRHFSYNIYE